jgi:hypothetical protein
MEEEKTSRRRGLDLPILLGTIAVIVILALVLGLGLGLGLKKHHNAAAASPSNSPPSLSSLGVEPWRNSTKEYALDFSNWDLNAPPTTRMYNFTASEITIAPDGTATSHGC